MLCLYETAIDNTRRMWNYRHAWTLTTETLSIAKNKTCFLFFTRFLHSKLEIVTITSNYHGVGRKFMIKSAFNSFLSVESEIFVLGKKNLWRKKEISSRVGKNLNFQIEILEKKSPICGWGLSEKCCQIPMHFRSSTFSCDLPLYFVSKYSTFFEVHLKTKSK